MKKVVVTGLGVVTPLGCSVEKYWTALKNGESGINIVTRVNPDIYPTKVAAEVKDYNAEDFIDRKELRRMDLFVQFALGAAAEAIEDSGLDIDHIDNERVGTIIGSGVGGLKTLEEQHKAFCDRGPSRVSPFFIPSMISDMASGMVAIKYKAQGPNYSTVSACASGTHAIGVSLSAIRNGEADVMIAGGTEAAICDLGMSGFCSMKAMSTRNENPSKASSPFDIKRDGFVMGEGAGILILESEEHAKARGAKIYCELAGFGFSCDANHMTAPAPGGEGAARSIKAALTSASVKPEEVQYINAHGTSTPLNDKGETMAIKTVFGDHAASLNINSSKSMVGHLLGASGAVEAIAVVKTIQEGIIHATINLEDPDPECDLNYTPNQKVERDVTVALSNSFGFGGHNATLALRKYS